MDSDPPLFEKTYETIYTKYSEIKFDENKMCKYDMVKEQKFEPVKVKKGQHLHFSQSYYHPSVSERFHFGRDGEQFSSVKNTDMGVFKIESSRYSSSATTVEKGQLPGLLFKFL